MTLQFLNIAFHKKREKYNMIFEFIQHIVSNFIGSCQTSVLEYNFAC